MKPPTILKPRTRRIAIRIGYLTVSNITPDLLNEKNRAHITKEIKSFVPFSEATLNKMSMEDFLIYLECLYDNAGYMKATKRDTSVKFKIAMKPTVLCAFYDKRSLFTYLRRSTSGFSKPKDLNFEYKSEEEDELEIIPNEDTIVDLSINK